MSITDEELVKTWTRDPDGSFRILYDRFSGVLLRFIFRFTGNREQAEEILHEVFAEVLRAADLNELPSELKAWLFTVAKNKSLNFEKRKKREIVSAEPLHSAIAAGDLEAEFSQGQLLTLLKIYQQRLPADLAATWNLRRSGMNYEQIAESLAIPVGTVKSRFSRLVEHLRKEFEDENPR